MAFKTIPLEAVLHASRTGALDHEAQTPGFGSLRRMTYMRRHEEDRAFFQIDASGLAVFHDVDEGVPLHLVEEILVGVVVEIGAAVGPPTIVTMKSVSSQTCALPTGGFEQVPVLLDPLGEVESLEHGPRA